MSIGEEVLRLLRHCQSDLQLHAHRASSEVLRRLSDGDQLPRLLPMLQLKARLFKQQTEGDIIRFLQSLSPSAGSGQADSAGDSAPSLTGDQWDTLAGLCMQFKQREATQFCLQQALQQVKSDDLTVAAQYWRKRLSVAADEQLLPLYQQLQQWVDAIATHNDAFVSAVASVISADFS